MRIVEILNRIIWDKTLDLADFWLEYHDRFVGSVKVNLSEISLSGSFITKNGSWIPLHRVRRIFWNSVCIFDRSWVMHTSSKASSIAGRSLHSIDCDSCVFNLVVPNKLSGFTHGVDLFYVNEPVVVCGDTVVNPGTLNFYLDRNVPLVPAYLC